MAMKTLLVVLLCSIVLASAKDPELTQENITRSPFVFTDEDFLTSVDANARYRGMQKFNERSQLLVGLENYRVGNIDIVPLTFTLPHHFDANVITVVINGQGSLTFMRQDKRQTFLLERGDILKVPAGTTAYGTSRSQTENFATVTFTMPVGVSGPGNSQVFIGAGGINPESFLRTFSTGILQAAYNTTQERLDRLLKTQTQGFLLRASLAQITALIAGGKSSWVEGPFNIMKKCPTYANKYGRLHEVTATDYKMLQDIDIGLSYFNITNGSMALPFFNSKATQVAYVIKGEGFMEMVVPQFSPTSLYERVSTPVKSGMVVVSPPGYSNTWVASPYHNLEILAFNVNAKDNLKVPYAGRNNVVSKFVDVAQELAFAIPAKEVQDIFNSQKELFFSKGPNFGPLGASAFM